MGLFDFLRRPAGSETLDLPLFPLNTVLFPEGLLSLKVFEQRYLDMAARCLKDGSPFGVCLIAAGQEVGAAAEPHGVGTVAEILECEVPQLGILHLKLRGGRRFYVRQSAAGADHLLQGRVELFPAAPIVPVPPERDKLLPLVQRIVADLGSARVALPHRYDDAEWVGYRITEVLPIQNLAKQKLLELDDPLARLEILEKYLAQRGLLG